MAKIDHAGNRRSSAARKIALAAGDLTYQGQPCRLFNHNGLRYAGSKDCVQCAVDKRRLREATAKREIAQYIKRNQRAFEALSARAEVRCG